TVEPSASWSVPCADVPIAPTSTSPASSGSGVSVTVALAILDDAITRQITTRRLAFILPEAIVQRYAAAMQTTASGLSYEDTVVGPGPSPKGGQTCVM